MMSCISAIGTANPEHRIPQEKIFRFMANAFALGETDTARLKSLYDHSGIDYRYSVIPDFGETDPSQFSFFEPSANLEPFISTEKRLQLYQRTAIEVALNAADKCLSLYSDDVKQAITHLVTVSCTGMYAPGIDIDVVERLGLKRTVERTCINFMGCYGAINALKTADYICRSNNKAKVLVICVELCTLHFQKLNTLDNWVASSLFSDGAAAVLVEHQKNRLAAGPAIGLSKFYTEFIPEGRDEMGWYVGNTGFEMRLTSRVSKHIRKYMSMVTANLFKATGLNAAEISAYAVHPGGKKILEAVEQALELPEEANTFAYEVLRKFGNMSSATILFVLDKMLQSKSLIGQNVLSFAFGPGLTVEGMVLNMQ